MPTPLQIAGNRDQLADVAERLVRGVASVRLTAGQLAAVRWQLCRQLLMHLSSDDRTLYPRALQDRRVAGDSTAFADDAAISGMFSDYLDHWTMEAINGDPAGFCADTIRIVSAMLGRMAEDRRAEPPTIITRERQVH